MTAHPHPAAPPQEPESISGGAALRVAAAGFVIVGIAVLSAGWLLAHDVARLGHPRPSPNGVVVDAPRANGRLEQTLIEDTASGWDRRDAQQRVLRSYQWIDRAHGVVHVPIDRAIDIVVSEGTIR